MRPTFALTTLLAMACRTTDKAGLDTAGLAGDTALQDLDGDGYLSGGGDDADCDDDDATTHPGAVEICDGIDNDCDGLTDEEVTDTWYADSDGDGFGDPEATREACAAEAGWVGNGVDCDDGEATTHPGAPDTCDGVDNDCDGVVDEDDSTTWYADVDEDGYGDDAEVREDCARPEGYVERGGDCDDEDPDSFPGNPEVCDEADNDCNGEVDEGVTSTVYEDRDGDGWGTADATAEACAVPDGYAAAPGDCDDDDPAYHPSAPEPDCTDPHDYNCDGSVAYADVDADGYAACEDCDDADAAVNPSATEVCNGIDDDCDGDADDADAGVDLSTGSTWYGDVDGDGYGNASDTLVACAQPSGHVADATDCDDGVAAVNPGATEVCNRIDDDCDALIDDADGSVDLSTASTWYADADGDLYGDASSASVSCAAPAGGVASATDCDDTDAAVNPGATEVCNSLDDDCDALVDDADGSLDLSTAASWYTDADADGYGDAASLTTTCVAPSGTVADATDCDDSAVDVHPGATEICNSRDDDCDALVDDADGSLDLSTATAWYVDGDGDGYGGGSSTVACVQPSGTTSATSDCDDTDVTIHPGATETCDGEDDDCDGTIDEGFTSVSSSFATASPSGSCNGNSNRSVTFTACGCSPVTLTGSFRDNSDGSNGQVVGVSTSSSGMTLTWDDAPSGGDCDLDIRSAISWTASYSGGTLTIQVSDSITGYSAGNSIAAGYSITGYSTYRRSSGSGTRTFTYSCTP